MAKYFVLIYRKNIFFLAGNDLKHEETQKKKREQKWRTKEMQQK